MRSTKKPILKELGKEITQEIGMNLIENLAIAVGGKHKTRKQLKKFSKKQQNVRSLRKRTTKRRQIHKKR